MLHVLTLLDLRSRRFGSYIEQELSEFLGPTTAEPMTTIEGCMSGVRRLNAAMHIRINEIGAEREASQAQTKLTESKLGLSMREAMGLVGRTQKQRVPSPSVQANRITRWKNPSEIIVYK